jgi:hypothetical protein
MLGLYSFFFFSILLFINILKYFFISLKFIFNIIILKKPKFLKAKLKTASIQR